MDGNRAFGQVSMHFACEKIKKINKEIQVTSVINTGHIGRLSDYSENLSKAGFINLIFLMEVDQIHQFTPQEKDW